jgi:hypothetical protein
MRGDAVRDNDAVQKVIAEAGKKLGYGCMVMTIERTPDTNSHYMIFFSKKVPRPAGQAYAGFPGGTDEIKITFDIPSFGLVKGELDHGPDWIEPEKKLALIRDIMKVAADGKELAALPMSQEINVNSMVARQLGVAQNLAGGIHGGTT